MLQSLDLEFRPNNGFIAAAIQRALQDRFAVEDSESKTAVVIGESLWLARALGLNRTRILALPYPDFTIENLALLSDEYDFVIADRVLHRCASLEDAGRETIRVLRPGGWFVHTTSILDFALLAAGNWLTLRRGLEALFPHASAVRAGPVGHGPLSGAARPAREGTGWNLVSWIAGRKAERAPAIAASVTTRKLRPPVLRFRPRPSRLGVMALARNEAPYLLEWVAYYRVLGFGQITIYDNDSNDASARILAPLAKAGIINARHWRDRRDKQNKAYNHAVRKLRPFVEWCLFADLDEFLFLDPGLSLEDLLPREADISGVVIPWRWYGSAGQRNRGVEPIIERFTTGGAQNTQVVKSLVRLRDVRKMEVHTPRLIEGRVTDVQGRTVENLFACSVPWVPDGGIRINHYCNRSFEEFESKRARSRGERMGASRRPEHFDLAPDPDHRLLDTLHLLPAVKSEISALRRIVDRR